MSPARAEAGRGCPCRLFNGMPARTVFSWNALVGAYSSWSGGEALRVYGAMRASAAPESAPDRCTLASVLKACVAEGDGRCGGELHGLAVRAEAGSRRGRRLTGGRRDADLREAEAEAAARGRLGGIGRWE